jgi:hypothetical protein
LFDFKQTYERFTGVKPCFFTLLLTLWLSFLFLVQQSCIYKTGKEASSTEGAWDPKSVNQTHTGLNLLSCFWCQHFGITIRFHQSGALPGSCEIFFS